MYVLSKILIYKYDIPHVASDVIFRQLLYCVSVHQASHGSHDVTSGVRADQGSASADNRRSPSHSTVLCVSRKTQDVCWRGAEERWTPNQQNKGRRPTRQTRVREVLRASASLKLTHRRDRNTLTCHDHTNRAINSLIMMSNVHLTSFQCRSLCKK